MKLRGMFGPTINWRILRAIDLIEAAGETPRALAIGEVAGASLGRVLVRLLSLEDAGYVTSEWIDADRKNGLRPRRYELTDKANQVMMRERWF